MQEARPVSWERIIGTYCAFTLPNRPNINKVLIYHLRRYIETPIQLLFT